MKLRVTVQSSTVCCPRRGLRWKQCSANSAPALLRAGTGHAELVRHYTSRSPNCHNDSLTLSTHIRTIPTEAAGGCAGNAVRLILLLRGVLAPRRHAARTRRRCSPRCHEVSLALSAHIYRLAAYSTTGNGLPSACPSRAPGPS